MQCTPLLLIQTHRALPHGTMYTTTGIGQTCNVNKISFVHTHRIIESRSMCIVYLANMLRSNICIYIYIYIYMNNVTILLII
jgi:hypothetical protein